ncbi:MAG: hypothetical protein Q9217_002186 [Psora testacea]
MPSISQPLRAGSPESLHGIPYEDTKAAKPPIPITIPAKSAPDKAMKRLKRLQASQQLSLPKSRSKFHHDIRRDSGLAPSTSSIRDSRTTLATDIDSVPSIRQSTSLPNFPAPQENAHTPTPNERRSRSAETQINGPQSGLPAYPQVPFMSILTEIPTGSFEDLTMPGQVEFSKRGSMLIGGKKANPQREKIGNGRVVGSRRQPNASETSPAFRVPKRVLSADEEMLSNKVRSMYEDGGLGCHRFVNGLNTRPINGIMQEEVLGRYQPSIRINGENCTSNGSLDPGTPSQPSVATTQGIHILLRDDNELAGGIEDWEDVHSGDVDRYGFIVPHKLSSHPSSLNSGHCSPDQPRLQRMSTLLQLASEAPRRQRNRLGKTWSAQSPAPSEDAPSSLRPPSEMKRPISSHSSYRTTASKSSKIRSAANRLPHNKDRRYMDEAGDMLTLPPGLANIAEDDQGGNAVYDLKRREWEREEKWRKMGKVVNNAKQGGGMVFHFDTKSPKVIERTWKGIPDRWRATAWHAFLTASAKKQKGSPSDEELIAVFKILLKQGSPDDVQIDIDVPRTINSHIMFRRRYRGGQRLLFRVLHCMSIYFPETGYVQGMAALAATLLCYFDEEMTFVMLVRLWQLRGLEQLYKSGFAGLMEALEEFEKDWLGKGEVAAKLNELGISSTAYGTRWYLTLFNYSIPFPAQLRVWDVFMLLGDPDVPYSTAPPSKDGSRPSQPPASFHHGLDVLHACSAALIDGTREILLDSDFENAMKVLTSWIPVKDEELLMRVARVEWKMKRRKHVGGG